MWLSSPPVMVRSIPFKNTLWEFTSPFVSSQEGRCTGCSRCIRAGQHYCHHIPADHQPGPPGSCPQLLCLLLRGVERAGARMPACSGGIRLRHRRHGLSSGGSHEGLDLDPAAPARQLGSVERQGRRYVFVILCNRCRFDERLRRGRLGHQRREVKSWKLKESLFTSFGSCIGVPFVYNAGMNRK